MVTVLSSFMIFWDKDSDEPVLKIIFGDNFRYW